HRQQWPHGSPLRVRHVRRIPAHPIGMIGRIAEGIWSVLRRTTTANRAFADPDDLITAVRRGLRQLQYRHDVLDGCLTGTGLRRQPP
ncbi:hypothetical protein ABZ722_32210, partial [Streptomyces longwoodensis]